MHRKVAAALVAALALALASGCGSSQKTETVSRAQLISRLESACRAGTREASRQLRGGTGQTVFLQAILANMRTIMDRVGKLETAGSAKAAFDDYKATLRTRIDKLERIAAAGRADRQHVIDAARPAIGEAGTRAHDAIVRIGARHICI